MEAITFTSGMALVFGILHALEPGHGKTALLTYLASGKRTWLEGLVISLSSAITHSLSVFVIAFVSHYYLYHDENHVHFIGEFLAMASGAIIIGLGLWLIQKGRKSAVTEHSCSSCNHHSREGSPQRGGKFLTSGILGVATGMIPCPTIVVAFLSGMATGNSLLGLQSVLLFALGMSVSLMAVVLFFGFGGMKLREKVGNVKFSINWNYLQGAIFIAIGLFTALYH